MTQKSDILRRVQKSCFLETSKNVTFHVFVFRDEKTCFFGTSKNTKNPLFGTWPKRSKNTKKRVFRKKGHFSDLILAKRLPKNTDTFSKLTPKSQNGPFS
jgi:hypothetical protein